MHGRQVADAHIHFFAQCTDFESPILGHPALCDIQVGHDFDAGRDGGLQMFGRAGTFIENAINAVTQAYRFFHRFNMDIAGMFAQGFHHNGIDDADDGRFLGALQHFFEADILAGCGAEFHFALGHIAEHIFEMLCWIAREALQQFADFTIGCHHRDHIQPGMVMHAYQPDDVKGVAHGHG